jgi:hypothetical protein
MSLDDLVEDGSGQVIILTVTEDDTAKDISSFTTAKEILFKAPDGKLVTKTATFTTDGTDGKVQCTLAAGDLDQRGDWEVQAHIESASQEIYSVAVAFTVGKRLQ